jgi:hypothetical protein
MNAEALGLVPLDELAPAPCTAGPTTRRSLGRAESLGVQSPTVPVKVPLESARALCKRRGGPLVGRQRVACSARCRARRIRCERDEASRVRDVEMRRLLEAALMMLKEEAL